MSLRSSVEETIDQYAWGYDDDELDLLAGAFAPDGTLNHAIDGSFVEGREQIRAWMDEARGRPPRRRATATLLATSWSRRSPTAWSPPAAT